MQIDITHIDTACILLNINGYKILTDPTLDQAGGIFNIGANDYPKPTIP